MRPTQRIPRLILVGVAAAVLGPVAGSANAATVVTLQTQPFGSRIQVSGEPNNDVITMTVSGGMIMVTDTGPGGIMETHPDCTLAAGVVSCLLDPTDPAPPALPAAPVDNTTIFLGNGTDSVTTDAPFRDDIFWGTGDKTISSGPGNDTFSNGPGNDLLDAGDGDDNFHFTFTADGADVFNGGPGDGDSLDYDGEDPVSVSLDGQPNDGRAGEGDNAIGIEQVRGSRADDTLMGDDGPNELEGSAGNDLILGMGGNDGLFGENGDDTLVGGLGRDSLRCDIGFDSVVLDPLDVADGCERRGAAIAAETASVAVSGKAKVRVSCPIEEANPCLGSVVLLSAGTAIGTGTFNIPAGQTKSANVKLTNRGRAALKRNDGSMLADVEVQTQEPAGVSVSDGEVMLKSRGKPKRSKR